MTWRYGSTLAVGLALLAPPAPAKAGGVDDLGAYATRRDQRSPQEFAFELRLGPYLPRVDDEFDGATPFEDTFGNDTRWLFGVELDWQALRIPHFGSLGPGFGVGYTKASAKAPLADGDGRSEQDTSLAVLPTYAVGVLRADVLARETPIPLAAYAKLGLGYALWWVGDGESLARAGGRRGEGRSYGLQWALGAMLLLDPFDPASAVTMDATTGVNHSYVFFEWYDANLNGFGGDVMNVGARTWFLGLALEI